MGSRPLLGRRAATAVVGLLLVGAGPGAPSTAPQAAPPTAASVPGPADRPEPLVIQDRRVVVDGPVARALSERLGLPVVATGDGAAVELDPHLLLATGPSSASPAHHDARVVTVELPAPGRPGGDEGAVGRNQGRTGFVYAWSGPTGVLADLDGDGIAEVRGSTPTGWAVLDGATGVTRLRVTDDAMGHLGRVGGREHLVGLTDLRATDELPSCVVEPSDPASLLGCSAYGFGVDYEVVVRRADDGREVWRTPVSWSHRGRSSHGAVTGLGLGSDEETTIEQAWRALVADGVVHGHVTGRLEGTTTIRTDATGLGGTAQGEGRADLVLHAPDGTVVAERSFETTGPSQVTAIDDATGDGRPDVALVVASWDPGSFLCLPVHEGESGVEPGGCLLPYDASHLDVLVLDGRDLATARVHRHDEPVGRGFRSMQVRSVGDVDGDGLGDLVANWSSFQDTRWSASPDQRLAASLPSGGEPVPIGRGGDHEFIQQVIRSDGAARVLLGALTARAGFPGSFSGGGLLQCDLLPPPVCMPPSPPADGDAIEVAWRWTAVDLPTGAPVVEGERVLREEWAEGEERGDAALVFGLGHDDLDGDPLLDAVLGLGWSRDGAWTSRTVWVGSGTARDVLDRTHPVERWRLPVADLDGDGDVDTVLASGFGFGPRDSTPAAILHGTSDRVLWPRPAVSHGLARTADLDGQPGPDVLLYPRPTPTGEHHQVCLARGRTGQVVWCSTGA